MKPCTIGSKHKWAWLKDRTNIAVTITERGATKKMSRRGVYQCECGEQRLGTPRSGL